MTIAEKKKMSRADILTGHFGHIEEVRAAIGRMLVTIVTDDNRLLEISTVPTNTLKPKMRCNFLPRAGELVAWNSAERQYVTKIVWRRTLEAVEA